jgi:threonylcarbamoyladenosine tRNA methylthiotransferase MtaB
MARYYLKTYGCKVNQCDSDSLASRLESWGLEPTDDPRSADLCIVNTCTVTAVSDSKCMKALRSAGRANPGATIVGTGCLARRDPAKMLSAAGVDAAIDIEDVEGWLGRLKEHDIVGAEPRPMAGKHPSERTRVFVKVQDGCESFCSYCIVPFVRGKPRSVPLETVCDKVNESVKKGAKEAVLTGIHLGLYGTDISPRVTLAALLRTLLDSTDIERIRLSSIEVNEITGDLLELFASSKRLQRHFHIPLQSADDAVLCAMNRHYTADDFRRVTTRIREIDADTGIATDVMVGFPTETDQAFENTVRFVEELEFSRLHVFKYSPRPGTAAAALKQGVPPPVAKDRSNRMIELGKRLSERFARRFVGKTVDVLIESKQDTVTGWYSGFSSNYVRTAVRDAAADMVNTVVKAVVEDTVGGEAVATTLAHVERAAAVEVEQT